MQYVACYMESMSAWTGRSSSYTIVYGFWSAVGSLTVLAGHAAFVTNDARAVRRVRWQFAR